MSTTQVIDYTPFDYQQEYHTSSSRYHLIVGGRRVGKSKMAFMDIVKHCLQTPKAVAWWIAPTFAMAREIGWAEFKDHEEVLRPAIATAHETLLRVRFKNGSVLYFKGADNDRSLRGRGLTYLVVDEAAFVDQEVWRKALFPALADRKGKALLISTPNGRNWFWERMKAAEKSTAWEVRVWPTYMNPIISDEDYQQLRSEVDEMTYRQEFLAEFVTQQGMVYDDFGDENILEDVDLDPHWEYYLGVDFGYANPTAIAFFGVDTDRELVFQFDEIYAARKSMHELGEMIHERLGEHGLTYSDLDYVFTDPAGNAEELSSGISPVDFLRRAGFHVRNMGSEIAPGVALVRSFIKTADGERRYFVTQNCKETIRSLYGYTYQKRARNDETVKEEPSKDGVHDHMCDAIRYFFVNQFQQNRWLAEKADVWNYGRDTPMQDRMHMKMCATCNTRFMSRTADDEPPYNCKDCANV